jgi:hypothetical protein
MQGFVSNTARYSPVAVMVWQTAENHGLVLNCDFLLPRFNRLATRWLVTFSAMLILKSG